MGDIGAYGEAIRMPNVSAPMAAGRADESVNLREPRWRRAAAFSFRQRSSASR